MSTFGNLTNEEAEQARTLALRLAEPLQTMMDNYDPNVLAYVVAVITAGIADSIEGSKKHQLEFISHLFKLSKFVFDDNYLRVSLLKGVSNEQH